MPTMEDLAKAIMEEARKAEPSVTDVHVSTTGSKKKPPTMVAGDGSIMRPENDDGEFLDEEHADVEKAGSLYVHRPLKNAQQLHDWAKSAGISNVVPPDQMHVTNVYSRGPVTGLSPLKNDLSIEGGPRHIAPLGDKGAVVMHFNSGALQQRWNEANDAGASWDYPTGYKPHVTLSYDAGGKDLSGVTPPDFPLHFGPEQHAPLNENWAEDNGLRKTVELAFTMQKFDLDKRMIFGWASISSVDGVDVIDKQGDRVPIDQLEPAIYDFVLKSRTLGNMHETTGHGSLVECMVFTPEKAALGLVAKNEQGQTICGAWTGFYVGDDDLLKDLKAGGRPEFSIGGKARRVDDIP